MPIYRKLILGFLTVSLLVGVIVFLFYYSSAPRELTPIKVGLSWEHEAQFAGLYWADQKGLYEKEGLKVEFFPYRSTDLAEDLEAGEFDFALLQTDTLFEARSRGLPIKAIFADYRIMPTCYFSKKASNIVKPQDMAGKVVGVAYSERYPLIAILRQTGVGVSQVNIMARDYSYKPLADGTYDVEAGWVTDGDNVRAAVGEYNKILPLDYGVNWYADLISATEDTINRKAELVKKFLKATSQGWQEAVEHIDEAALLAQNYGGPIVKETGPEHLKFVLRESAPLIHTGDQYIGWMEKDVFEKAGKILSEQGVFKNQVNAEDVYTPYFLMKIYGENK